MKILMVLHQLLPEHKAGTEISVIRLTQELMSKGHEVEYFYGIPDQAEPGKIETGTEEGVKYTAVTHHLDALEFKTTYSFNPAETEFHQVLRHFKPDIVHIHHLANLSARLPVIAAESRIPVIFTLHDYSLECLAGGQRLLPNNRTCKTPSLFNCAQCLVHSPYVNRGSSKLRVIRTAVVYLHYLWCRYVSQKPMNSIAFKEVYLRQQAMIEAMRAVNHFIAPSQFIRNEFIQYGLTPEKVTYLAHPFISQDKQKRGTQDSSLNGLRLAFIGSIIPQKGLHLLTRAVRDMAGREISLSIYGDFGGYGNYNDQILKDIQSDRRIEWKGTFKHDQISQVMSEIDLLVIPSLWFENAPLVMTEAMSFNVPVLASDVGGMLELVVNRGKGWVFKRGSAAKLREHLEYLLRRPDEINQIRQREFTFLSAEDHAERVIELYTKVNDIKIAQTEAVE